MHFSPGRRGFYQTADSVGPRAGRPAKRCFDLGLLTALKAATTAMGTEGNAADVILKARWGGHIRHAEEAKRHL